MFTAVFTRTRSQVRVLQRPPYNQHNINHLLYDDVNPFVLVLPLDGALVVRSRGYLTERLNAAGCAASSARALSPRNRLVSR